MTTLFGILAVAILFATFGALARRGACHGNCDSCPGECPLTESDHAEH